MTTPRANERGHVYRSGECPGRCDSRLSPSVHQGDLREGIPSTSLLMSVELHNGIEVIEKEAFYECRSLREILFPPTVSRAIEEGGILWLLGVDGCDSKRRAGGDWGGSIQ